MSSYIQKKLIEIEKRNRQRFGGDYAEIKVISDILIQTLNNTVVEAHMKDPEKYFAGLRMTVERQLTGMAVTGNEEVSRTAFGLLEPDRQCLVEEVIREAGRLEEKMRDNDEDNDDYNTDGAVG